jgi:hypothetical protein
MVEMKLGRKVRPGKPGASHRTDRRIDMGIRIMSPVCPPQFK